MEGTITANDGKVTVLALLKVKSHSLCQSLRFEVGHIVRKHNHWTEVVTFWTSEERELESAVSGTENASR